MLTYLRFSRGKVEVRTRATFRCGDCGREYHPEVHAYAGRVLALAAVAVVAVLAAGGLWLTGWVPRSWVLWSKLGAALVVAVIGLMASRLHRRLLNPRVYSPDLGRVPRYGEILLGCPRCGSSARG